MTVNKSAGMWACERCGNVDACERCDLVIQPILCDKCYIKAFLSEAVQIEHRIDSKMLEACRIRSLAEKVTSAFKPDVVKGGEGENRVLDAAVKLVELEEEVIGDIHQLVRSKCEIRAKIACLARPEERTVLELRYLVGKRWEDIASEMNYSWRQTHNIHKRALANIALNCTPKSGKMISVDDGLA